MHDADRSTVFLTLTCVRRRYMNNATIGKCSNRSSENIPWWDAELFAQQVSACVNAYFSLM